MLKIENIEVMGWEPAIRGMRNPMNSWEKSDSLFSANLAIPYAHNNSRIVYDKNGIETYVGGNDLKLMTTLRNAGTDHRKFMRMIAVYMDIIAPLYWWKEFDTYKVGTVTNSCSTMHKIAAKEFTLDDFSHEHLLEWDCEIADAFMLVAITKEEKEIAEASCSIGLLTTMIGALNFYRDRYVKTKDKK